MGTQRIGRFRMTALVHVASDADSLVSLVRRGLRVCGSLVGLRVVTVLWRRSPLPFLDDLFKFGRERANNPAPDRGPGYASRKGDLSDAGAISVVGEDVSLLLSREA
ncbi:MAG: hypothetical protein ABSF77_05275 [Spirochaetia bacterium]